MINKIVIRHLSGSRANQVDEFPAADAEELIAGRDAAAGVRFDPERDDLVSRQHIKIVRDPSDPEGFQLIDLQSRNGTFLNRIRIQGVVRLNHDDVIQLGAGGPEFRFEIVPPPLSAGYTGARPTREASVDMLPGLASRTTKESWSAAPGTPRPVGRATVERMLGDVFTRVKRESNRSLWVGVMALIAIIAVGSVTWLYLRKTQAEQAAAQQQTATNLQQMNQQLKQNPADVDALKVQIANLEQALQQSGQRNDQQQAANQAMLRQLKDQLEQANKALAQRPQFPPLQQAQPPNDVPQRSSADNNANTYESLFAQANDQYQRGHSREALALVTQAIARDEKRWEAWDLGARIASALQDYPAAAEMFEKSLQLAPAESRPEIQAKLDAVKQKLESK